MTALMPKHQFVRQLDLGTLELFVRICQNGSIGASADQAHLALSSVSKRIKELESLTGTSLLLRHARGVKPTAAGQCLLRHARSVLMSVEEMRVDVHEFTLGRSGYVHVFASASVVEQYMASEIAEFARSNPAISIDLSQVTSREVIQAVRNGLADIGICDASDAVRDLASRVYRTDELVLAVPKDHPLSAVPSMRFVDTLDYEQIGLRGSSMIQQLLETAAAESGHLLRQRIKVASLSALCRMVECGLGIGVIPHGALLEIAKKDRLQVVALSDSWARRDQMVYATSFDTIPIAARRFANHLVGSRETNA